MTQPPAEQPRRIPLDELTSDALDQLYGDLEGARYRAELLEHRQVRHRARFEKAEAELENARNSFPHGIKPALCKALAGADQRALGRLPIPDRTRYAEQADAVLRLMGWREKQLIGQHQEALQMLREAEAAIERVRVVVADLCEEPHPSHDHVCPDDVRRAVRAALDPQEPQP